MIQKRFTRALMSTLAAAVSAAGATAICPEQAFSGCEDVFTKAVLEIPEPTWSRTSPPEWDESADPRAHTEQPGFWGLYRFMRGPRLNIRDRELRFRLGNLSEKLAAAYRCKLDFSSWPGPTIIRELPVTDYELAEIRQLFAHGYKLADNNGRIEDAMSSDVDSMMRHPDHRILEIAAHSSDWNRFVIRSRFHPARMQRFLDGKGARHFPSSPLETRSTGQDYLNSVRTKLMILERVGADLSHVFAAHTLIQWLKIDARTRLEVTRIALEEVKVSDPEKAIQVDNNTLYIGSSRSGVTPLTIAIALKEQELVNLLIKHGASIDRTVPRGSATSLPGTTGFNSGKAKAFATWLTAWV